MLNSLKSNIQVDDIGKGLYLIVQYVKLVRRILSNQVYKTIQPISTLVSEGNHGRGGEHLDCQLLPNTCPFHPSLESPLYHSDTREGEHGIYWTCGS